jgi:hypothetical protein
MVSAGFDELDEARSRVAMTNKPPSRMPAGDAAGSGGRAGAQGKTGVPAPGGSSASEVADFVAKLKALTPAAGVARGRLIFAMDATMSREPTWDLALGLQGDMFHAVKEVGGLDVQLVFFRGAGECQASKWVSDPDSLARLMSRVKCHGGYTQIRKVLAHARGEAVKRKVHALVYVGDAVEESLDDLAGRAGELALLGVPVFLFQEGRDPDVTRAFGEIARLTKGAACRFDAGSARELRELLSAVAVYAAGGQKALARLADRSGGRGARLLIAQMKSGG